MIVPNKAISFDESILSKLPLILKRVGTSKISVATLYNETKSSFTDISQFLIALDTLFVLEKINIVNGEIEKC